MRHALHSAMALALAQRISVLLPGFPSACPASIAATAEDLQRWCDRPRLVQGKVWMPAEQALWLVWETRKCEEWPGTARMLKLFSAKFGPTQSTEQWLRQKYEGAPQ